MTAPSADDATGSVSDAADAVEEAREEFAATLDAIEAKVDPARLWHDLRSRVRSRVAEQPVTVAAVAVAGAAVVALAVVLVVRSRRS